MYDLERKRIDQLRALCAIPGSGEVLHGIGDDCAVLAPSPQTLVTTDAMIEGTHFENAWLARGITYADIAFHACAAAVSDIYAMGGVATSIYSSLIMPRDFSDADFKSLVSGYQEYIAREGVMLAGGNMSRGEVFSICTTVIGRMQNADMAPVLRSGARLGDDVYVSGTFGDGALAVAALEANRPALADDAIQRWRRLPSRKSLATKIAQYATAMVDVSDGFVADLQNLVDASGVGARIDCELLPYRVASRAAAVALQLDLFEAQLTGGEDYELLFTAPADARVFLTPLPVVRLGEICQCGVRLLRGGNDHVPAKSFSHFGSD